mgnify:FL=1
MKILMLTPYLPYPLLSGGQTRSYNLLKNLSLTHEITLFSLVKDEREQRYIGELKKFCKNVVIFPRSNNPWTLRNILLTGFSLYPFLVMRNLSPQEREAVRAHLREVSYDLIHAETFYVMPHIPKTSIPILLVEQTVEYLVYKHYVEEQAPFFLRPLLWIDIAKIKFWETYFWQRANRVVAMSEADRHSMQKLVPGLAVDIVPNGIDTDYFSIKNKRNVGLQRILYVGNFKWLQNREAVDVLATRIWPRIKKRIPNAKLLIVGMSLTRKVKELQSKDIEVVEGMPDIREAYERADVLVAPIEGPGGTRLKILEAMASGVPVVTTKIGIEGLDVRDGIHALIRNTEQDLTEATVRVLTDKKLSEKIATNARKLVREKYNWEASANALDKIYRQLANPQ